MYLQEIKLTNFGIYRGEHCIALDRASGGRNVTLVGGLNGRGKTTILEAVFVALYGRRAVRFLQDERIGYEEFLRQHTNKSALGSETSVELTFVLEGSNTATINIRRYWPTDAKTVADQLTVTRDGRADAYLAQGWDYYVEQIIPLGIARFFFFDSEKISNIANDDTYEEVKDSIRVLTGVQTVNQLINDARRLARKSEETIDTGDTAAAIEYRMSTLDEQEEQLEKDISRQVQEAARLRSAIDKTVRRLKDLESDFWKRGGQLERSRDQIVADKHVADEQLQILKHKALELCSAPSTPLLLCQPLLERTSKRIQEDEESRAVRYSSFILRQLQESLRKHISDNLQEAQRIGIEQRVEEEFSRLLDKEAANELLPISPATKTAIEVLLAQAEYYCTSISTVLRGIEEHNAKLTELDLHLSYEADNYEASTLLEEIKQHNQQLGSMQNDLTKAIEQQQTLEMQLEQVKQRRAQLIKELTAQEQLLDDGARIIKYATITEAVMTEFKRRLQHKKVRTLEAQILECFSFMAQKETMITDIKIDADTLNITLYDYQGGQLQKSQLSAGEKQIFAIAILWGLATSSGYRLPVIIDTPLGRLDSRHRTNLVKRYLPHASEQVLVLSTDEEVNGSYFELIEPYLNRAYTVVYDENEKCSSIVPGYFGGATIDS